MNEFRQERIDYAKYHKTAEKQLLPYFRKALLKTVSSVVQYVRLNGVNPVNLDFLIDKQVWFDVYPKVFNIIGIKMAKREYYKQRNLEQNTKERAVDILIDVWTKILRDYALNYTYQIERELNQTTLDIINRALGDAYELGLDRDGSIRLFEKNLTTALRTRSLTISRTEATTISNLGKDVGARSWINEQGGGGFKVWLGRSDERERHTHLEENNTIIPIDDLHDVGGEFAERPGDVNLSAKERINCRCTESYMSQNRYNAYVNRGRIVNGKLTGAS